MEQWLTTARPYLEMIYFLSGLVIAVAAVIALRQLRLMKLDLLGRSERAAKEKAIEAAFEYTKTLERIAVQLGDLPQGVPHYYKGAVGDFTANSIPTDLREAANKRHLSGKVWRSLDALDGIAAMFVTGVADEQTAFPIFGGAFCGTVAGQYDVICLATASKSFAPYASLIELYQIWSRRLSKMDLAKAREALEKEMSAIPDKEIPPLSPLRPRT